MSAKSMKVASVPLYLELLKERAMDDWQASQHADESALQRDLLEALQASLKRPLSESEAMLLAWGSGVANDFYKETH